MPSLTRYSIMIGVTAADNPPIKLNTPPIKPMRCLGANSETNTQAIEARPLARKAMDKNRIMRKVWLVKLAPIIAVESSIPINMVALRAISLEYPRRTKASEEKPESSPPTKAAKKGKDARKPDLMKSKPLYLTR